MADIVKFHCQSNQQIIGYFEQLLEEAKRGEIHFFVGAVLKADARIYSYMGNIINPYMALGAVDVLKDDIKDYLYSE